MIAIFRNPNINFLGNRKKAYIFSLILIIIGIIGIIVRGGFKYGIDFTGGTLIQVRFEKALDITDVRKAISDIGLNAEIQSFGDANTYIIKYHVERDADEIVSSLSKTTGLTVSLERNETVGPSVGKELQKKAFVAIFVGLVLMLLYIWFRFDFKFGLGAIIALFHDVFITIGIYTLLGKEITIPIVAALLTILGYSINDSIVISDRIRDHLKKFGKVIPYGKVEEIFNRAVNDTLSRTIITSFTTLLVLLSILIFGGPVIFDFAFALAIGVIIGTYSSIFVVAALVVDWIQFKRRKAKS